MPFFSDTHVRGLSGRSWKPWISGEFVGVWIPGFPFQLTRSTRLLLTHTRIADLHACVIDRLAMHVFSCPRHGEQARRRYPSIAD